MRITSSISILSLVCATGALAARLPVAPDPVLLHEELPGRAPDAGTRADTVSFGYYTMIGADAYAVVGESWTFDHGAADPFEGWRSMPVATVAQPFRRIDAAAWSGHANGVNAPIIEGAGSAWLGAMESEADQLCWGSGLGYGNDWCEKLTSPELQFTGTGSVTVAFRYFTDSEDGFDYTHVRLVFDDAHGMELNGPDGWSGALGTPAIGSYPTFNRDVTAAEFAQFTTFRVEFHFESDAGYSDEDGEYDSKFGACGFDAVSLGGSLAGGPVAYGFESGLDGWSTSSCRSTTTYFGVANVSDYAILDPCGCGISGNVLEFHDDTFEHPVGQHEIVASAIVNRGSLGASYNVVLATWDMYSELPQSNGVFYRVGWYHYPFTCPTSGLTSWSSREGDLTFHSTGDTPFCTPASDEATAHDVPGDAALYRVAFEVYSSCDAFGIAPTLCTGVTNFTPIFDNVQVQVTQRSLAPAIHFDVGTYFVDAWGQGLHNATTNPGNADVAYDLSLGNEPDHLGDSLVVRGPNPTSSTKWESRMWWRVAREGPGANAIPGYSAWKTTVADGRSIVGLNAQFTYGLMDSAQIGTTVAKNIFISEFRELDDDFAGENSDANEMIRDGILAPGTQIQYFITSNYTCTPSIFYLMPDTLGGNFQDFEILPSYRMDGGIARMPAILYVDITGGSAQYFSEHALNVALTGAGPSDPIPNLRAWDRYDFDSACSCWGAPMIRSSGGNNGATIAQLAGYRGIFINLGGTLGDALTSEDYQGLSDWLGTVYCQGNQARQGLILCGDGLGSNDINMNPIKLDLGVDPLCDNYSLPGCGPTPADDSRCVRIEDVAGGSYPSSLVAEGGPDYAYDAWGNGCPEEHRFSVLSAIAGGVGNRAFFDHDGTGIRTNYSQVTKSVTTGDNYRSVVDGVAWHHLSSRDPSFECVSDEAHIVSAMANELRSALRWIYDGNIPQYGFSPCGAVDVEESAPGRASLEILSVAPNPLRTSSTLRYALPARGKVSIAYIDASGRRVASILSAEQEAGLHSVTLTGNNDDGRQLAAGLYWVEIRTDATTAVRKVIMIR